MSVRSLSLLASQSILKFGIEWQGANIPDDCIAIIKAAKIINECNNDVRLLRKSIDECSKIDYTITSIIMANISAKLRIKIFVLETCITYDHILIKVLLNSTPECQRSALITGTIPDGRTPLHNAVIMNNVTIAQVLLDCLPENQRYYAINVKDRTGYTPLHRAVIRGHIEIITVLLNFINEKQRIEAINVKDSKGFNSIDLAENRDEEQIVSVLLKYIK